VDGGDDRVLFPSRGVADVQDILALEEGAGFGLFRLFLQTRALGCMRTNLLH
jgi:hypothetical protein